MSRDQQIAYLGQLFEWERARAVADNVRRPRGRTRRDHIGLHYDPHAAFEAGALIERVLFPKDPDQ